METAYFNRSLIVMCEYIVNKSANGLGGKNRGIVCREKIPQFVHIELSFESCSIKSYSSYPVSQYCGTSSIQFKILTHQLTV